MLMGYLCNNLSKNLDNAHDKGLFKDKAKLKRIEEEIDFQELIDGNTCLACE